MGYPSINISFEAPRHEVWLFMAYLKLTKLTDKLTK
jgi:hypothetical protein